MITADDSSALMEAEIAAIIQSEVTQVEPTIEEGNTIGLPDSIEAIEVVETVLIESQVSIEEVVQSEQGEEAQVVQQVKTVLEEQKLTEEPMSQDITEEQISQSIIEEQMSEEQLAQVVTEEQLAQVATEEQLVQDAKEGQLVQEVKEEIIQTTTTVFIEQPAEVDSNDGPRAKHLKQALRKALNNTIKSCSGEKLETCFPFNLKAAQMNSINSTIIESLQVVIEGVQKPFEELISNEGLVDKLNKVDEFTRLRAPVASATENASALTPQNLIDRRLYATKLSALNQLEAHLKEIESENSNLASELNARQSAFAERLDRLKSSQQLLDLALDQISQVPMEEMETLVDKMNHQYQPGVISLPKIKLNE